MRPLARILLLLLLATAPLSCTRITWDLPFDDGTGRSTSISAADLPGTIWYSSRRHAYADAGFTYLEYGVLEFQSNEYVIHYEADENKVVKYGTQYESIRINRILEENGMITVEFDNSYYVRVVIYSPHRATLFYKDASGTLASTSYSR